MKLKHLYFISLGLILLSCNSKKEKGGLFEQVSGSGIDFVNKVNDNDSLNIIKEYYSKVIKVVVPVSNTECAEICKLYENCFRLINISYTNEIADLCKNYNVDPFEMINASKTKPFGFMSFYPGLGIGGYCIPVNPYYLANGNFDNLSCLHTALKNTETRPSIKANEILKENKNLQNILVVGAAFKPGEVLLVNSPSIELVKTFVDNGVNTCIYDPLVVKDPKNYSNVFNDVTKNETSSLFNKLSNLSLSGIFEKRKGNITWLQKEKFNIRHIVHNFDIISNQIKTYYYLYLKKNYFIVH